jgi:hypothetical protein
MSKKILFLVLFILIGLGGAYFVREYYKDRLDIYSGDLNVAKDRKILNHFFIIHDKEPIYVDLILTKEQSLEFGENLKKSPDFHLLSLSNKKVEYIFHLREDGKRDFVYDVNSSELKAIFMPHIQKTDENRTIINLLPLTPNEVKKIK